MILQAFFGSAQTGLGYQFFDSFGAGIGSRINTGILAISTEAGSYLVDATVPINAAGVTWDSNETPDGISEDLRDAISGKSLTERLTSTRASYLDKLNVTGTLAHSDSASTYRATGFATPGDAMTLTSGERSTLATVIEAALLNEGDGQQLIDAILQVINSNLDLPALELSAISSAVRAELSTELSRIDANISSRNDVAPDNAAIAAVKAKTDNLPASPAAVGSPMSLTSAERSTLTAFIIANLDIPADDPLEVALAVRTELATELARIDAAISSRNSVSPDNASIAAIKLKTDNLPADPAGVSDLSSSTAPTVEEIADAVWNEAIADHQNSGSTGKQLQAAGASGDPWTTQVPGAYEEGTAGAAVGRLNNTPAETPVVILPDPADDPDLCLVFVDSEDILGQLVSGLEITIRITSPQPAVSYQGKVISNLPRLMTESESTPGRYTASVERNHSYQIVSLELFGVSGKSITVTDQETINLAS